MKEALKKYVYLIAGGIFFIIGMIGVILPLLPTTVFMILAAGCFARSSPRLHQSLLNNRWCGSDLRLWEEERVVLRSAKKRATVVIIIMFAISIALLTGSWQLQVMLVVLASILLFFLWRMAEFQPTQSETKHLNE